MLIINADDWGRSTGETDAAFELFDKRKITSATAMVFMSDSKRAAEIALREKVPTGLHLNFIQSFTESGVAQNIHTRHERIVRFLAHHRYCQVIYNPFLHRPFLDNCSAQLNEFMRLYGKMPTHFDGHRHMHLCANMLVALPIPSGQKVRRSFSFHYGEKSFLNRQFRAFVSRRLLKKYKSTDFFFALSQNLSDIRIKSVFKLAADASVELMTHPIVPSENSFFQTRTFEEALCGIRMGSYVDL